MKSDIQSCRIGDQGKAKSPLAPSGVVEVNGNDFSARAVGGVIEAGSVVVVTDGDIGGLVVQAYHVEISIEQLPNFGHLAFDSFGDKAKAKAAREEEERRKDVEAWLKKSRIRQLQFGFAFGALATWLLNPVLVAAELNLASRVACGLAIFVAAWIWAVVVFASLTMSSDNLMKSSFGSSVCPPASRFADPPLGFGRSRAWAWPWDWA